MCFQNPNFKDIKLGLTKEEARRSMPLKTLPFKKIMTESIKPERLGRQIKPSAIDFAKFCLKGPKVLQKLANRKDFVEGLKLFPRKPREFRNTLSYLNSNAFKTSEIPSASYHASARALAKLASIMANHGKTPDSEEILMEKSTWDKMHANPTCVKDAAHYSKITSFRGFRKLTFLTFFSF